MWGHHVRYGCVCDPGLRAVEDEATVDLSRGGLHPSRVRTMIWLSQTLRDGKRTEKAVYVATTHEASDNLALG